MSGRYKFRALDPGGKIVTGLIDGADEAAAIAALRDRGQLPLALDAATRSARLVEILNRDVTGGGGLATRDRVTFTESLAVLFAAGVSLDRALGIVAELAERRRVRGLAARLRDRVVGGASLADAMAEEGGAFPPIYRGLVRAGETGAMLADILDRLAMAEAQAAKRRAALISALIYPAFLFAASIGAVTVLLLFVVPTFEPMLDEAGVTPPFSTRVVLGAAKFLGRGWPAILAVLVMAALAARLALARPGPRLAWHAALLRLPLIGPLRRKLASAALARLLGEMLRGGVGLPASLRLARDAASDAAFRAAIARAIPEVEAGRGLAGALGATGVPAPLLSHLVRVGEESGRLSDMLLRAADILGEESGTALNRAMALITPVTTLVMGGLIALIVSSILFALFSLNDLALNP